MVLLYRQLLGLVPLQKKRRKAAKAFRRSFFYFPARDTLAASPGVTPSLL